MKTPAVRNALDAVEPPGAVAKDILADFTRTQDGKLQSLFLDASLELAQRPFQLFLPRRDRQIAARALEHPAHE